MVDPSAAQVALYWLGRAPEPLLLLVLGAMLAQLLRRARRADPFTPATVRSLRRIAGLTLAGGVTASAVAFVGQLALAMSVTGNQAAGMLPAAGGLGAVRPGPAGGGGDRQPWCEHAHRARGGDLRWPATGCGSCMCAALRCPSPACDRGHRGRLGDRLRGERDAGPGGVRDADRLPALLVLVGGVAEVVTGASRCAPSSTR